MSSPSTEPWRDPIEYQKDELELQVEKELTGAMYFNEVQIAMNEALGLPTLKEQFEELNKK